MYIYYIYTWHGKGGHEGNGGRAAKEHERFCTKWSVRKASRFDCGFDKYSHTYNLENEHMKT